MRNALFAIAVLLFLPQLFSPTSSLRPLRLGLAGVFSGDEPHYFVMLNSLLRDHDLDLANNYRAAHAGDEQAGAMFAGKPLDHHVVAPSSSSNGALPAHEYSTHWPGMPALLALLLFPLDGSAYLEPGALFCSYLATLLALLAFVSIGRSLGARDEQLAVVTLLTFLGTPVWHYSRTLFPEPYALACVLSAHALYLRGQRDAAQRSWARMLLVGAICALAMTIKNTFVLFAVPLGLHMLAQRRWRELVLFSLPLTASLLGTLWLNHAMFGSYLHGPQAWRQGEVLTGLWGILFSRRHGLFMFAPIVLSALLGWPAFLRAQPTAARLAAASFACLFAITAAYLYWYGGYCYGPRYIAPVIPFLMLGLLFRPWRKPDVIALGALALLINAMGALPYWRFFNQHPLGALFSESLRSLIR